MSQVPVSFTSWQYPFLLAAVYVLYWRLPGRSRIHLLLAASYYFYACWDVRFLALIVSTTCVDYLCGRAIHGLRLPAARCAGLLAAPTLWLAGCRLVLGSDRVSATSIGVAAGIGFFVFLVHAGIWRLPDSRRRVAAVALSLGVNLSILGFFKYYGFFAENLDRILDAVGLSPTLPILEIVLPVGISFYTFQSLSYVIDCYRGKTEACLSFPSYAAYISFFPQLVAGPIERSTSLLPQILVKRDFSIEHLVTGCRLILVGYFKKVFVADNCALIANYAFEPGTTLNAPWALLGVVAFAFQIYGDFSGYTDIARGSARLFGITLNQNFRFPYLAVSPSDFWRRWHISLSEWFRDYVYIPLGGNRGGRRRVLVNLGLTMAIAGLWHGANWNFVLWGCYHGLLLVLYRVVPGLNGIDDEEEGEGLPLLRRAGCILLMFGFTLIGWALFRVQGPAQFMDWVTALGNWSGEGFQEWYRPLKFLLFYVAPLWGLQALSLREADEVAFGRLHWVARGGIYAAMIILIAGSVQRGEDFIYFQF